MNSHVAPEPDCPASPSAGTWSHSLARYRRVPLLHDAVALSVLLTLCLLTALTWMPFSLYRLDIATQFVPFYTELGLALRSFDVPGWLPTTMSGRPMAADPISGWGYLPAMVIMTAFPTAFGFKLFLVFQILFAAATAYLYARNLGIRPLGAFTTGSAFVLGNFMERTSCCNAHVQVAIWFPAIFLCIDRSQCARTRTSRLTWLTLAGVTISQMVAGFVGQRAYYGGLVVAVYFLYRFLVKPHYAAPVRIRLKRMGEGIAVSGLIAASMLATVILPRLDAVSRSNLSNLYDKDAGLPADPGWTIVMLAERLLGPLLREGRWYYGVVILSLAIMSPILLGKRRDVLFFTIFSLVIFSLILRNSPTVDLFNLLPEFESLHAHAPDRVYVVLAIAPAVLAGELIDAITDRQWRPPSILRSVIGIELPVVLVLAALILVKEGDNSWLPASRVLFTVLVCSITGVAIFRRNVRVVKLAALCVISLLIADPVGRLAYERLTDDDLRSSTETVIDANNEVTGAAQWLLDRQESGEIFRYFGYDVGALVAGNKRETYVYSHYEPETAPLLVNNRSVMLGLEDIQGYNPIQIRRYVTYFRILNGQPQSYHMASVLENGTDSRLLDLLNVRYIVIPAALPPDRPDLLHISLLYPTVYIDSVNRIVENPRVLPRAWIVHEAIKTNTGEILDQLAAGAVDPRTTVLLDTNAPKLVSTAENANDSVDIVSRSHDEIRLRVRTASRGMVVLSEIWDPGWTATVDGDRTRVYRANYMFRGILVGAGEHDIVLRFPANTVKWTALLYLAPALTLLGLTTARFWTPKRWSPRQRTMPAAPPTAGSDPEYWSHETRPGGMLFPDSPQRTHETNPRSTRE